MSDDQPVRRTPWRARVRRRSLLAALAVLSTGPALSIVSVMPARAGVLDDPVGKDAFLPVSEAFRVRWALHDAKLAEVEFKVAPGYYLYRERIRVELKAPAGGRIGTLELPAGEIKDDPYIGRQAVLHDSFTARLALMLPPDASGPIELLTSWQGCAEAGLCYPPVRRTFTLALAP